MADRNPALAIALLFLVLTPQMAVVSAAGRFPPRINPSPRTNQRPPDFKPYRSNMPDSFPSPGNGGSRNGGRSQAPATTAGKYIFSFDVGTPPQHVSGAIDITSVLMWTQCACPNCGPASGGTLFYPNQSTTMTEVACTNTTCQQFVPGTTCPADVVRQCFYTYTDGAATTTTGYLASETFTFDSDPVPDVVFGCSQVSVDAQLGGLSGVIGLGRGPSSLVSQLQAGRFSYYLAPDDSNSASFIYFGDYATPKTRALSTPLLENSGVYRNLYYVGVSGVRVDGQDLAIPPGTFDLRTTDGTGGVYLSTTIPTTYLDEAAYGVVKAALVNKIGLPTINGSQSMGLDLCYTSQSLATRSIPAMALVFSGGAVMELQTRNYFYKDTATGLQCLSILPSPAGSVSVLGNLIQVGTHMIYDISGSKLTFESLIDTSPSSAPSLRILPVVAVDLVWVVVYLLYWVIAF